jgi:hypothetical protein
MANDCLPENKILLSIGASDELQLSRYIFISFTCQKSAFNLLSCNRP